MLLGHAGLLFQIGSNNIHELLGRFHIERSGMLLRIHKMASNVVFDHLSHEPGHGAACARYQMQDLLAAGLAFEGSLNRLHLASHSAHAGQELLLFADRVSHCLAGIE